MANPDIESLDVGTSLVIPLPCACFNGTDESLPAVYLSYVVRGVDTMAGIARRFSTTVADLTNVNAMGAPDINPGDILAVPLLGKRFLSLNLFFFLIGVCVQT